MMPRRESSSRCAHFSASPLHSSAIAIRYYRISDICSKLFLALFESHCIAAQSGVSSRCAGFCTRYSGWNSKWKRSLLSSSFFFICRRRECCASLVTMCSWLCSLFHLRTYCPHRKIVFSHLAQTALNGLLTSCLNLSKQWIMAWQYFCFHVPQRRRRMILSFREKLSNMHCLIDRKYTF